MEALLELDSLTVYDLVDNETDGLSTACGCCASPHSGIKYTPEFARVVKRRQGLDFDNVSSAAHGLSLLLVAEKDGKTQTLLMDAGPNPPTFAENVKKHDVDLSAIGYFVLCARHEPNPGAVRKRRPAHLS